MGRDRGGYRGGNGGNGGNGGGDYGDYDDYDEMPPRRPPSRGDSRGDGRRTPPGGPGGPRSNAGGPRSIAPGGPRSVLPGGPRSIAPGSFGSGANGSQRRPPSGAGGPRSQFGGPPPQRAPQTPPRSNARRGPSGPSGPSNQPDDYGDDYGYEERPQAPQRHGGGFAERARDLSRTMSRQLGAIVRGTGRVVRREAEAIAHAGGRPQLPPPPPSIQADLDNLELPRYRRSRIRQRARKWRLSRVRANPLIYFSGLISAMMAVLSVLAGGGAGSVYAVNYYNLHRSEIQAIQRKAVSGQNTVIYDRNGKVIYTVRSDSGFNYYRPLSQINQMLIHATLDTEDHSFYSPTNIGVDFQGTLRAVLVDLQAGGAADQGGSTITQQLVKNLVLKDSTKAVQRKLNEMILAIGVNANYTKDQILEMYLNTIDYGDQNQGIEAAARNYFGLQPSKAKDGTEIPANFSLTLGEIGILAGLPNAPTYYLPIQYSCDKAPCADTEWANPCVGNPEDDVCVPNDTYDWGVDGHEWLVWRRARTVLYNMFSYGDISQDQYNAALQEVHDILTNHLAKHWAGTQNGSSLDTTKLAPGFVDYVEQQLFDMYGISSQEELASLGLSVYTTLDYNLQKEMEDRITCYVNGYIVQSDGSTTNKGCGDSKGNYTLKWYTCPGQVPAPCQAPALKDQANAHNAAGVAIDPRTGEILAMVGSVNYGSKDPRVAGFYNVTTSGRSLGSSVKPVIYSTAFQMGWNPGTMLQDDVICFPGYDKESFPKDDAAPACEGYYTPHNFEPTKFAGKAPIRVMLANSLNIPATEAMSFVGDSPETSDNVMAMAARLGIPVNDDLNDLNAWHPSKIGPTTALGTLNTRLIDLTGAFGTFANNGVRVPYNSILQIQDSSFHVIYAGPGMSAPKGGQVVSPQTAYMMTSILSDNDARAADFGADNPLNFDDTHIQIAAKTGTASGLNGPSDIVTVGYSPYLTMGVWLGNSDGSDLNSGIIGITGAGYVFADVMRWAITNYHWPKDNSYFQVPSQLAVGSFNCDTGLALYKDQKAASDCYITGNMNLYVGYGAGAHWRKDTDWYIQGQAPLVS